MTRSDPPDERTADAVECLLCLTDPDADPGERARWAAWLSADPRNRAAFNMARDVWSRPIPNDVWPSDAEVAGDTSHPSDPVPAGAGRGTGDESRMSRTGSSPSLLLVAASLLVVVTTVVLWRGLGGGSGPGQAAAYETGRGEFRKIALGGGSTVTLGPLSRISLEEGSARSAQLETGEAMFVVAHDPDHPFRVSVRGGTVVDIGTTFAVTVSPEQAVVTVVEGSVSVSVPGASPVSLGRDRQVAFAGALGPVLSVDGDAETGWVRGRLAYVDRPLSEVVADLGRYTTREIAIGDPAAGALRYTGTIEPVAIDAWLAAITRAFPLQADRDGNRVLLRSVAR